VSDAVRRCYKQDEYVGRIERALGVSMRPVSCFIVNTEGMQGVMRRSGWSANDAVGVVGFQVGTNVYVLDSAPWTVLHELVHLSGVNADRINRFVAEGLTEAIAEELRTGPDEHRPTYPQETSWVKGTLLPRLRMTAVELGRIIAQSSDPPSALADLMVRAKPGVDRAKLVGELRPQVHHQPSFNRLGHVTRLGSCCPPPGMRDDGTWAVAGVMIAGGVALLIPRLFSRNA
jgi:hypothetical protein